MNKKVAMVLAVCLGCGVAMAAPEGRAENKSPHSCGCVRHAPITVGRQEADGVTVEQLDAAIAELQKLKTQIPKGGSLKPPTPKEMVAQMEAFRKEPEFARLPEEQKRKFEEGLAHLRREASRRPSTVRPERGAASAAPSPYVVRENGQNVYFIPKGHRR